MTKAQKHHIRQLQKAVELSRIDFDALTPIEHQRLRLDLLEFQMESGLGVNYLQRLDASPEELSTRGVPEDCVKEMIEGIEKTLSQFAEAKYPSVIPAMPKNLKFHAWLWNPSQPIFMKTSMEPGYQAGVFAFLRHFEGSGLSPDRVRHCPLEDCGNLFVLGSHARTDRMRYCSVRCSRLAATRAYRKKQKPKKKRKRA
jgi:hypothetical protein